ncbi:MAG TPA: protein kinase [Polyangia bacterium]|nr:protein kinase [Polyangia bacterium]
MSTDPKKPLSGDDPSSSEAATTAVIARPEPAEPPYADDLPARPRLTEVPPTLLYEGLERYQIEIEHARGGLGRILIARDLRFGRLVAIKELLGLSEKASARFLREAVVSARLEHPSIIPVYDAGRWPDGTLYYTMKLISGRSFHEFVEGVEALDDRLALVPHVLAVADAMAYAHSHHIIHRDLKPANIMVGSFGETMVIDWGLAKDLSEPTEEIEEGELPVTLPGADLTIMGAVLGTPQYMAPEQARGERVDERVDVYAIGAVLFYLLVGKAPHSGTSLDEILSKARSAEVALLAPLPEGVPKDLAAIIRKAMARDPEHRYRTAGELAEDLRRFLRGQLVSAHEYSGLTLLGRWLARHRIAVTVAALLLTVLAGVSIYGVRRILAERNAAEAERRVALARSNELVRVQAENALEHDPTQTLAWLKTLPPDAKSEKASRELALDAVSRGVARHVFRKTEGKTSYNTASPDGRYLALADDGRTLRVWDLRESRTAARLPVVDDVAYLSFSPDGQTLAFTVWGRESVWLWRHVTGEMRELRDLGGMITSMVFSGDGRQLLLGDNGPEVRLLELASGKMRRFEGHEGLGTNMRLSPDGRLLVYAGPGGLIHRIDLESGDDQPLHGPELTLLLEFSPDGKALAAGTAAGTIWLWDLGRMQHRPLRGHTQCPGTLQFSHDGRRLLSASADHTVRLWDVEHETGQVLGEHAGGAAWAVFSSDEQVVASAGDDRLVRLYYLRTGDQRVLRGHEKLALRGQFLGNSPYLLTLGIDHTTRIWQLPPDPARVLHTGAWVGGLAFSPDGHHLAVADANDLVWYWDVGTGEAVSWHGHTRTVSSVAFSPDGRMMASASVDSTMRLWDTASGSNHQLAGHLSPVPDVLFAPDGRQLAFTGAGGGLHLWDLDRGQDRILPSLQKSIRSLAYSPDGQRIAAAGSEGDVSLWELGTGQHISLRGHQQPVLRVAFSHDGRWLVSGGTDGSVRLWDVSGGRTSHRLLGQQAKRIRTVAFSPDDRLVAAAGEDGAILLCQTAPHSCRPLDGHAGSIVKLDFSPDGQLLASAGNDSTVRLWDVAQEKCLRIHRHDAAVTDLAFSPDGKLLASAGTDSTARLWRVDPTPAVPLAPEALGQWLDTVTSVTLRGREPGTW